MAQKSLLNFLSLLLNHWNLEISQGGNSYTKVITKWYKSGFLFFRQTGLPGQNGDMRATHAPHPRSATTRCRWQGHCS